MNMHPAVSNGSYDVARLREDFPALAMKVYGKPLVYLDNAASAQKPNAVLDRMTEAYKSEYANVHRGLHYLANAATEGYEGGRAKVAKFLNAARPEEIVFTRNATEAINLVASSWGAPNGPYATAATAPEQGAILAPLSAFGAIDGKLIYLDAEDRLVFGAGSLPVTQQPPCP